ncbi:hypothetical protein ACUY3P_04030 [Corynebacterium lehmanniae]
MMAGVSEPPLLKDTRPWGFRIPEFLLLAVLCVAVPGVAVFGGYVVIPVLAMLVAALVIGLPLQNRRVNDFVFDAGYLVAAYVLGFVLGLTGFPFEDQFWLNATLGAASIVLQVVGWSALSRRALGYRQWKSNTE